VNPSEIAGADQCHPIVSSKILLIRGLEVDQSFHLLRQRVSIGLPYRVRSSFNLTLLLAVGALGLGLVSAYLIVNGQWYLAVGMILAIPGLILLHNYPVLGLVAWLAITPYLVAIDSGTVRKVYWLIHRGLPLMILAIMVLGSMFGLHKYKVPKPTWFELAMVVYAVSTLFSVLLLNPDPANTVTQAYDRIIVPMLLYVIIRILVQDEEALQRLLPILLFIALSQAFYGFVYVTARGALPNAWVRTDAEGARATGSLRAPSTYSTTLLFVGAIMLHTALSGKVKDNKRLLLIGVFAACMMAVFFTFSRASWLAGIAFMIGLVAVYPRHMTKLAIITLPVAIILISQMFGDEIYYANRRLDSDESVFGRLPVMLASVRMFEAKPVYGWGYGNFDLYDRQFQGRVGDAVPRNDHASHNLFLTVLSEQGFTGLSLYLAPVIALFALTLKNWRKLPPEGFWSRKLLAILWLVIASHVIVNNFSNMRNVFGLGVWWITLALIANLLYLANESTGANNTTN
jgi:O-antigen ligase